MANILMPKATALWLVENTTLTFEQIADFTGLHKLEVQAIADEEVARMRGVNPIAGGLLTQDEITRVEADSSARLVAAESDLPQPTKRAKGPRYTPVSKRADKPNAILWLVKNYPHITDAQITKLVGTTTSTISKIRDRTHWNMANLKAEDPVSLGLCSKADLEKAIEKAQKKAQKDGKDTGVAAPAAGLDATQEIGTSEAALETTDATAESTPDSTGDETAAAQDTSFDPEEDMQASSF